jgi:rSAM/selenodomain-associated transferase 2
MDAHVRPRLSVVLPCLNESEHIAEALDALIPFQERGTEIIVVDGGSRDDTVARARQYGSVVIECPRGRARQMNAGAARARGEVLLFLHADTRLPPHADDAIASGLSVRDASWGRFDVMISGAHPMLRVVSAAMNIRSRLTHIATGDQAIFVTRAAFDEIGGYREMPLMEDVELCARLKRRAAPVCLREKVATSGRRWERNGVAQTIFLMWRLRVEYWLGADPAALAVRYDGGR